MIRKSSRIFIAGHSGLIGSACVRRFQSQGYTQLLTRSHAELNLLNGAAVFDFFDQSHPEYVILAAGKVGGILENKTHPADFIDQNLKIQQNIFAAAVEFDVRRLVFFGSSCMYPRNCSQPMSEDLLFTGKPESTSIAYAIAKLAGVQQCLALNEQFNRPGWFIPVIPNSVYGSHDNFDPASGHVLSALMTRFYKAKINEDRNVMLWGTGAPRREFLYADDLADACELLLQNSLDELVMPINIGPGEDISIKELAMLIANRVGYRGSITWDHSKPDGALKKLLDSSRIHRLGWNAKTSLQQGIQLTFDWYTHHKKYTYCEEII